MITSLNPACPRCARTDAELISSRPLYRAADLERSQPLAIVRVFKCPCGLAFTHDLPVAPKNEPPPEWSIADGLV